MDRKVLIANKLIQLEKAYYEAELEREKIIQNKTRSDGDTAYYEQTMTTALEDINYYRQVQESLLIEAKLARKKYETNHEAKTATFDPSGQCICVSCGCNKIPHHSLPQPNEASMNLLHPERKGFWDTLFGNR